MGIFGGGKPKGPDPELLKQQEAARKRAEAERLAEEKAIAEEKDARGRQLRGAKSLLTGGFTGYDGEKKEELGV